MDIKRFKKLPVMGIIRGVEPDILEPLIETVMCSGLQTIEITMNTKGAPALIKKTVAISKGHLYVGAGTVLDKRSLAEALDADATFIVMPALVTDVVEYCVKNKIPVFPGALMPQEIYDAWNAGAAMVKVFPAGVFGPAYFREIKGPFSDIELLACGGVTLSNLKGYFANGASAVTFGASVFSKVCLAKRDFSTVASRISEFLTQLKSI